MCILLMNGSGRGYDGAGTSGAFNFNTCLASLHTYLGGKNFVYNGVFLNVSLYKDR